MNETPSRRDILRAGALSFGGLVAGGCAFGSGSMRVAGGAGRPALALSRDPGLLPAVDALRVTALIDCCAEDGMPRRADGCKVTRPAKPRSTRIKRGRHLLSEYGVSLLLQSERGGQTQTVLYDFGLTDQALLANLDILGVDPSVIDAMVLSHGHADHYGGLEGFVRRTGTLFRSDLQLFVGNGKAFARRWKQAGDRRKGQGQLQRASLDKLGLGIRECPEPTTIGGQAMVTGTIPMDSAHERASRSSKLAWNGAAISDDFEEELGLVYNVAGKGLVVLTACGHRGVVNTLQHAVKISGAQRVHALLGGLHLGKHSSRAFAATTRALQDYDPKVVLPMHCTTTRAARNLSAVMGDRVLLNSTGSVFEFA